MLRCISLISWVDIYDQSALDSYVVLCTCRCHRTAYNNTTDKTSNYFYSSHPDIFMCRHSRVFVMIMSHATATWLPGLQQAHCIQNTFLLTDLISLQFIPSVIIITSPRCLKSDPPVNCAAGPTADRKIELDLIAVKAWNLKYCGTA